jgi:hypothetical protein
MNDDYESPKKRRERERYAFVRNADYKLYESVCAFAGTLDLDIEPLAIRANVENYCMELAKRLIEARR